MRFGKFDVTEGQLCVIAVMLCTSIFGSEFWDISVSSWFTWFVGTVIHLSVSTVGSL